MQGPHRFFTPSPAIYTLFWLLVGALFFLPGLGVVPLLDWDEANFAEITREMVASGDYLRPSISYLPFTEKPPLFFWLQALAMKIVGTGEYAARLPNAMFGMLTLPLLYQMGRKLQDHTLGMLWAGLYLGTFLPHLYFKSGIIDPVFNFFIFLGLYCLVLFHFKQNGIYTITARFSKWWYLIAAGIATGLAVLTKGPAALAIIGLSVAAYWVFKARLRWFIRWWQGLLMLLVATITAATWYGLEIAVNGPAFMTEFFQRQLALFTTADAGHGGFPGYHLVVLLIGCFPASVFAIAGHKRQSTWPTHLRDWHSWMVILLWVVVLLFSIVQSKIVHYSSMAYFPLTFLAAAYLRGWLSHNRSMPWWSTVVLWSIGIALALVTVAVPVVATNPEWLAALPLDSIAKDSLQAQVDWPWYTLLPGIGLVAVLVTFTYFRLRSGRKESLVVLLTGLSIWVAAIIAVFLPRAERYSQHGALTLLETLREDAYVYTYGYRSYLPFFYYPQSREAIHTPAFLAFTAEKEAATTPDKPDYLMHSQYIRDFILFGPIDKPGYLLVRTPNADQFASEFPQMKLVNTAESFALFARFP